MKDRRLQIKDAIENMIHAQRAREFQWLAVQLSKTKWPELEATQEQDDGGEDATSFFVGRDGRRRLLACSLTGTLTKVRQDASRLRDRQVQLDVLVFVTAAPVTNLQTADWSETVLKEFGHELHVITQAELITLLEQPRHAWLCRRYLKLEIPDEQELSDLEVKARTIAAKTIEAWKTEYRFPQSHPIELTLTQPTKQSSKKRYSDPEGERIHLTEVKTLVVERKRIILAGPPGAGKTFTTIQLADVLLQDTAAPIPILVSLPGWASSGRDLQSYLEHRLAAHGLAAQGLTKLFAAGRFALLLNGWNEISEKFAGEVADGQLKDFSLSNPGTPVVISTRAVRLAPPFSQGTAAFIHVEPLSLEQKLDIVRKAALDSSSDLLRQLETNPTLADVTDTPLFLGAVIELARAGDQIPTTRFGILKGFIEQVEAHPEHSVALRTAPCAGFYRPYLECVAGAMTQAGSTTLSSGELLAAVAACSQAMRNEGCLGSVPSSHEVVDCLVKHHLLVLSPSLGAYRFLHQQFQEWFAAESLYQRASELEKADSANEAFAFQRDILNHVRWHQPLTFLMERLSEGGDEQHRLAAQVIHWGMPVDLLLAAELAGIASERVWPYVRDKLQPALRKWYAKNNHHHCSCALAAMLATGAPDFQDILWPLIESDNNQARFWIYRAWRPFPLNSLGPNWRIRFEKWSEERRAEFIQELCWHANRSHIDLAIELATTDAGPTVRLACLDLLEQAGAYETLVTILDEPAFGTWEDKIYKDLLRRLSKRYLGHFVTRLKAALAEVQELGTRSAILELLHSAEDPGWVHLAKTEIDRLLTASGLSFRPAEHWTVSAVRSAEQPNAGPYLASYVEMIHEAEPAWAVDWVVTRLLEGRFWWEPFTDYMAKVPEDVLEKLATVALDSTLEINTARRRAELLGKNGSPMAAGALLKEYLAFVAQNEVQRRDPGFNRADALKAGIRALPLSCLVDAVVHEANYITEFSTLRTLVELVMPGAPFDCDLRSQLTVEQTEAVRLLAFRLEEMKPHLLDDQGGLRGHLAVFLGAVGRPDDVKILETWLIEEHKRLADEEAERKASLEAWEASGRTGRFPRIAVGKTTWWHWYRGALLQLGCPEAVDVFLKSLHVPELLGMAAWGLVQHSRHQSKDAPRTDRRAKYSEIYEQQRNWQASGKMPTGAAKQYADAIFAAITSLLDEVERSGSKSGRGEIVTAVAALAGLNDIRAIPLLLKLSSDKYSHSSIADAFHALVRRGVVVPGKEIAIALEPFFAEHEKEPYGSSNDTWYAAIQGFATLLFSDDPTAGVARIRRVPPHRLRDYYVRDILELLGACRVPEAASFLVELSAIPEIRERYFRELTTALSDSTSPTAHQGLLDLLDQTSKGELSAGYDTIEPLAKNLAKVAVANEKVWADIKSRCKTSTSKAERDVLARILYEIGTDEAAFVLCDLIHDEYPLYGLIMRMVEDLAESRTPAGGSGSFYVRPRALTDLRKRLIRLAKTDTKRKSSALELLAVISAHRLERGFPIDEPLHPDIDSLSKDITPWPLQ